MSHEMAIIEFMIATYRDNGLVRKGFTRPPKPLTPSSMSPENYHVGVFINAPSLMNRRKRDLTEMQIGQN